MSHPAVEEYVVFVRQKNSLFSHVGVSQDVHIDEERLLVFTHPTQKQSPFLQQALEIENEVKGASYTLQFKRT